MYVERLGYIFASTTFLANLEIQVYIVSIDRLRIAGRLYLALALLVNAISNSLPVSGTSLPLCEYVVRRTLISAFNISASLSSSTSVPKIRFNSSLPSFKSATSADKISLSFPSYCLNNSFIQSIADMGRENFARNMIVDNPANYYSINSDGTIDYKAPFYDLPREQQDYIVGHATRNSQTKANGGYLTIKRKRK